MALDKDGKKKLPKGITWRENKQIYMIRFSFQGISYTFYEKTLKDAKKTLADKRYEIEHGLQGKGDKITLNSWYLSWFEQYKVPNIKETSANNYKNLYSCYVKSPLGGKQLSKIRPVHIQAVYNEMLEKGLSVGTISSVNTLLYNIFETACKNDLLIKNPCQGVVLPSAPKAERRVLTVDEQSKLLYYMAKDEWVEFEPLIRLLLGTGLRVGEALGLTWDCVDLQRKEIVIKKTLAYVKDLKTGKSSFKFQPPKSNAGLRTLPLVSEVADALQRQRKAQMLLRLAEGTHWRALEGFELMVFTTSVGTPLQESRVRKILNQVSAKINEDEQTRATKEGREPVVFEHIYPHCLRHTFATRAFENSLPPKSVQAFLGHSTMALTMDLYTHTSEQKKREDMDKLEGVFNA